MDIKKQIIHMKNLLLLLSFSFLFIFASQAQSADTRRNTVDEVYTGKRFDSYGKPLKKQNKRKPKVNKEDKVFWGDASNKSYPIGMDKDRKKKKKAKRGKKGRRKGRKSCDCPGR